ncbi:MAG: hypothetical protein ACLVJI_09105, partial [Bacilli bacterium]
ASALFLRLVSLSHHFNVLCAVSFSESGYKGTAFIFNRQIFRELFFQASFSRTPRPRRSDTLRHHAKASRPPVCFAFAVAKVLPFALPTKLFRIFFCPIFQHFSQSPIYQRVIRTKKIAGHSSRMPAIPFISRI